MLLARKSAIVFPSGEYRAPPSPVAESRARGVDNLRLSPVSTETANIPKGCSRESLSEKIRYFPSGDQSSPNRVRERFDCPKVAATLRSWPPSAGTTKSPG